MQDTNKAALPASWLGHKLINKAAAEEMGASVLPSDKALSGRVMLALTDADGDPLHIAGIVVGVTFTAAEVRYSLAFPVAPQPTPGGNMYAVVENVESSLVLADLPDDETVFDAVMTEDAAALIPREPLVSTPAPVLDSVGLLGGAHLEGALTERCDALRSALATDADPAYTLGMVREVIDLTNQVRGGAPAPVAELDPTEWPGYAEVLRDEALAVKWQDRLDSFFQSRLIDVRNALRGLGWTGEGRNALEKNGIIARFDFWQVGAGKNVVGMTVNGIRDDLTKNTDELAAAIDETAALPEPKGPSAQFITYRDWIAKELAAGNTIPAGTMEVIRMDTRLEDGEAEQLEALATAAPAPQEKRSMEQIIKIAADTLAQLRRIDVYRVLDVAGDQRAELATFIATGRADLVREVTDVMAEEWPDLGWTFAPAAVVEHTDGSSGALLVPNKDGKPKELTVPPVPVVEEKSEQERNPARSGDMALLNSVIGQSVDMWDDALADKIEGMAGTYENDGEMMELVGRAIDSYTDFMLAAA
jgi:hypothetical protein